MSVKQGGSLCQGCQRLHDDGYPLISGDWNISPMKNADSCVGCSLLVEGVTRIMEERDLCSKWNIDYHASRLSMSYHDKTLIFAGTSNPWGLPPSQRPSFQSTRSRKTIEQALEWARDCAKHKSCQSITDCPLPTRILDIGSGPTNKIVLRESLNQKDRYSCLSYCWGEEPFIKTLKENIDHHKIGIAFAKLPPTFQHAIEVVRHLGIRYLWIDSLCIVQDDHQDWEREAGKMANIYHNSFITISATAAVSPRAGLFTTSSAIKLDSVSVQLIHHFPNTMMDDGAHRFPVLSRGWTYQERMLAPRVLHFGPEEIFWECYDRRYCECAPKNYAFGDEVSKNDYVGRLIASVNDPHGYNASENVWRRIVVAYSPLALTVSSDKLPALSGLAEKRCVSTNQKYLAGLWESTLVTDLLWYRYNAYGRISLPLPSAIAWRAPSWSWASVDGPIMYEHYLYCSGNRLPSSTVFCEILQAECNTTSQSMTGSVTSGFISLRCSILPVSVQAETLPIDNKVLDFRSDNRADLENDVLYAVQMAHIDMYNEEFFLVVKPSDLYQKTFLRVGLASLSHEKSNEVQWPEKTEITLI
ncbi:HET-domain-containing protein [Hyaloscypha hepaticicola]|uniref:HET-domain-containing protein n=1 Tax=Hyaloscypha hepaticicola TaxID=2082293 RepID=A0A2J6Q689_9HELO|nr:HET-domain-containing protein [Hyaloscypha hepaticicola]